MDFSSEDLVFCDEVRGFLAENLSERLRTGASKTPGVFVEPDIGLEWHRILDKKGWVAYHWPEEYGGTDWTPVQRYIFERESALAGAPAMNAIALRLLGPVLCEFGTNEQKDYFLPRIRSGEDYWAQGYSEPGSGSDLASLKTSARLEGDDYIINGSKIWTTHAHHANWIFCLVRTSNQGRKQQGISFLLVPMDQEAITVSPILSMSGDHEVNQVFFDNAITDAKHRVGEEGQGWTIAKFLLENERGGSCAAPRLLAQLEDLRLLASGESAGESAGKSAGEEPSISGASEAMSQNFGFAASFMSGFVERLARLRLQAEALEFTELRILAECSKGRQPGPQTSLVKLLSSNLVQDIDELRTDLFGYDGIQLPAERPLYGNEAPEPIGSATAQMAMGKYLNSRASTIYGGSSEVQKNIIAKSVLGL